MKLTLYSLLLLLLFTSAVIAQGDPPRLSPKATVSQVVGYTEATITYSRPGVKGRDIWGDLVPFKQVWRTGANEATVIEFSDDVIVEGKEVPKGKYSLFTIPGDDQWTVIFNRIWEQWGAFNYNPDDDLIRFNVKPVESDFNERLLFTFDYISPYSVEVVAEWENLEFSFTVETSK